MLTCYFYCIKWVLPFENTITNSLLSHVSHQSPPKYYVKNILFLTMKLQIKTKKIQKLKSQRCVGMAEVNKVHKKWRYKKIIAPCTCPHNHLYNINSCSRYFRLAVTCVGMVCGVEYGAVIYPHLIVLPSLHTSAIFIHTTSNFLVLACILLMILISLLMLGDSNSEFLLQWGLFF